MENPPASQCSTTDRGDDDQEQVCVDLRLDDQRKPKRVCECKPDRRPAEAGKTFVPSLASLLVH